MDHPLADPWRSCGLGACSGPKGGQVRLQHGAEDVLRPEAGRVGPSGDVLSEGGQEVILNFAMEDQAEKIWSRTGGNGGFRSVAGATRGSRGDRGAVGCGARKTVAWPAKGTGGTLGPIAGRRKQGGPSEDRRPGAAWGASSGGDERLQRPYGPAGMAVLGLGGQAEEDVPGMGGNA